jgi:hypothetical protein
MLLFSNEFTKRRQMTDSTCVHEKGAGISARPELAKLSVKS